MNGWSYDYMLALDNDNCPTAKSARDSIQHEIEAEINNLPKDSQVQAFFDKYPKE